MKKNILNIFVIVAAAAMMVACSEDINSPQLPPTQDVEIPQGSPLSEEQLFGVWGATFTNGSTEANSFEQTYRVEFQMVEDGEAVLSHWYIDAGSETPDSVCNVEYTYTFDGTTVMMTPKATAAAAGARAIRAVHIGDNQLVMITENEAKTDIICTLNRIGDPAPSITGVNRTLPLPGETVTITGRNLQFVDHIFLPTSTGEVEIGDFQQGSKQISFVVPEADYVSGSIRCLATGAHESCYSPAYMFCYDCVFFHNFKLTGSRPYTGTEYENTINITQAMVSKAVNLSSTNLPATHCLSGMTDVINPDSLLSIFGNAPVAWPVSTKTDNTGLGYIRFSSGDRFQYVLDNCGGILTNKTPCSDVAIQMDIYVSSNGEPVWNTGYMQYRLNKDQNSLTSSWVASVAAWDKDNPMSFQEGWKTFTIPLTAFSAAAALPSLGDLVSRLKSSKYQTILTMVNYPMDSAHPAQALSSFQFNIANIRLVPYKALPNKSE